MPVRRSNVAPSIVVSAVLRAQPLASHCATVAARRRSALASRSTAATVFADATALARLLAFQRHFAADRARAIERMQRVVESPARAVEAQPAAPGGDVPQLELHAARRTPARAPPRPSAAARRRPAWQPNAFRKAWGDACRKAKITGLTFHDLRGTAVTRLAEAECSHAGIATITGHSMRDVGAILDKYLARTDKIALAAIANWKGARRERKLQNGLQNAGCCPLSIGGHDRN